MQIPLIEISDQHREELNQLVEDINKLMKEGFSKLGISENKLGDFVF